MGQTRPKALAVPKSYFCVIGYGSRDDLGMQLPSQKLAFGGKLSSLAGSKAVPKGEVLS